MATFDKTEELVEIFRGKHSDIAHAYAALAGALLGTATDDQIDKLITMNKRED